MIYIYYDNDSLIQWTHNSYLNFLKENCCQVKQIKSFLKIKFQKKKENKFSIFRSPSQGFFISQNPNCYVNLFQKLWFEEWGSIFQKTVGFLIWWLTSSLINFHTNDFVQQFLLQIWFSHTKVQVADRSTWHFPVKYGRTNVGINWNVNKESLHNGGGW